MVGLIGPNGAGKTTFMRILVRQLLASTGSIIIDGMDIGKNENYLKNRLGYLPQEFGLYEELTVYQFLRCLRDCSSPDHLIQSLLS